jgi:DeoR/GlpR family transcriptional regulator of sugar metabolism
MARKSGVANVRFERIVDFVNRNGEASAQALAEHFGVSPVTIRRDLMLLERSGRVTRTHGGAIPSKPGVVEFAFQERGARNAEEKHAIALAVALSLKPGCTVALDSGTTTLEVAKAISSLEGLTVLTCSLAIAAVLQAYDSVETVLLGGTLRRGSPDLTGWLTEETLQRFRVDYAIVGADGITPEGAYASAVDLARICEAVLKAGTSTVLVADHSKMGRPSFVRYATLKQFDRVVTDSGVPATARKWLNTSARQVEYVELGRRG